mmetsp:Transcript_21494/g.27336  ORF Transcript_21494/g.27336 Transcript_21494/m.27336 type:complete len:140 (-) Transcript_21494:10-429(-)
MRSFLISSIHLSEAIPEPTPKQKPWIPPCTAPEVTTAAMPPPTAVPSNPPTPAETAPVTIPATPYQKLYFNHLLYTLLSSKAAWRDMAMEIPPIPDAKIPPPIAPPKMDAGRAAPLGAASILDNNITLPVIQRSVEMPT